MDKFLGNNRVELIARCKDKVAKRPLRQATERQLKDGVPLFLTQLIRTLQAERADEDGLSLSISGASGGDVHMLSEIGIGATAHGKQLLQLGYTVDQVVHDYGDLCQAITELAYERDAPFAVDEFRTLNRCLDNAIADAVTEFTAQRDTEVTKRQASETNERFGSLIHELRNHLATAIYSARALEAGNLPMSGATGSILKRSHAALVKSIDRSLAEVREQAATPRQHEIFAVAAFIEEAAQAAELDAEAHGCTLSVEQEDASLGIYGDRDLLLAALANLLQNAFKFTHPHTKVTLSAYAAGDRIRIDVADHCGGLPSGNSEKMFMPFSQRGDDKTGLGLGLSIARKSVVDDGGVLRVRNLPGTGCVFTMDFPRCKFPSDI